MYHHTKFRGDRPSCCRDMAFFDFSTWRPSAILDFQKFEILTASTVSVTMLNFALIGETLAKIWPFSIFQDRSRPPSWIFLNFENLTFRTLRRASMHHLTKFRADRLSRCRDVAVFRFLNMTAVRHLVFAIRLFGPPSKCIGGLCLESMQ